MAKKNFYYDNFSECAKLAVDISEALGEILLRHGADVTEEMVKSLHMIEHAADVKRRELLAVLVKDFITPIEREDIIKLSDSIDDISDSIEDILIEFYVNNERELREGTVKFLDIIKRICLEVQLLISEFSDFRKSKRMPELISSIHSIEEEGDALYISSMRSLHREELSPNTIMAWRNIYRYFEKCCDKCADVADIVEGIVIANV